MSVTFYIGFNTVQLVIAQIRLGMGLYTTPFDEPSTKANDSSRNCMNAEDVDAENETSENNAVAAYSYLSEDHQQCTNTQQGGSLLITGRLKVMDLWKN